MMYGGYVLKLSSEIYPMIQCTKGILNGASTGSDRDTLEIDIKKGIQRHINHTALA